MIYEVIHYEEYEGLNVNAAYKELFDVYPNCIATLLSVNVSTSYKHTEEGQKSYCYVFEVKDIKNE